MSAQRIRIPFTTAVRMIGSHAVGRIGDQLKAIAFIVIYLSVFQYAVFGSAPQDALSTSVGIGMVVLGLTLFLEGLLIGLMPLGERVGIQLPSRSGNALILVFGLILGVTSTLAEPAVASLRVAGGGITAWESPVLFHLLQVKPQALIYAIGAGVGIAVALGLLRFIIGFSVKPLAIILTAVLLGMTVLYSRSQVLSPVLGLAWDTGAVTTGAVTVPLVLALGVGISRSTGKTGDSGNAFGVVMMASALPVITVLLLALMLAPRLPAPSSEEVFFSAENRDAALAVFGTEKALADYAMTAGGEGTQALFPATPDAGPETPDVPVSFVSRTGVPGTLAGELTPALRAVLPLTLLLLAALFMLLRDRPRHTDELLLGILFLVSGMALLTAGIRTGLATLGDGVGRRLPEIYTTDSSVQREILLGNFDTSLLLPALDAEGERIQVFYLDDGSGYSPVPYVPERYDPASGVYTHRVLASPLRWKGLSRFGIGVILLFAFGMGFGSTLAEPALRALGRTVEILTVGTIRSTAMVRAVSLGVGIGLVAGVLRIILDIPMAWMLVPPYLLLIPLTVASEERFTGIAWDCGGVTTGTITVPLVLSLGLGLGNAVGIANGFGILAMASVYPIVTVLLYGMMVRFRQNRILRAAIRGEDHNG